MQNPANLWGTPKTFTSNKSILLKKSWAKSSRQTKTAMFWTTQTKSSIFHHSTEQGVLSNLTSKTWLGSFSSKTSIYLWSSDSGTIKRKDFRSARLMKFIYQRAFIWLLTDSIRRRLMCLSLIVTGGKYSRPSRVFPRPLLTSNSPNWKRKISRRMKKNLKTKIQIIRCLFVVR